MIALAQLARTLTTARPDPLKVEERLSAWGEFWRYRIAPGQAESFEGGWRSPQHWDALPVTPEWLDIDRSDVQAIEAAVSALPLFEHILLKTWYVRKWAPRDCMAAARVAARRRTKSTFERAIADAQALLLAELERPAVVRKQRASEYVRALLGLDPLTFSGPTG